MVDGGFVKDEDVGERGEQEVDDGTEESEIIRLKHEVEETESVGLGFDA